MPVGDTRETEGGDLLLQQEPPSVVMAIEQVLDKRKVHLNFFRPSMLQGCDRANVFYYNHAPSEPQQMDNRIQRILDNGTAVHEVLQKYLADHPDVWFAPESRVLVKVGGALVRGSCDGVMIRRSDLYRWGVEFKTINHEEFEKLKGPKPAHVLQASLYARLQGLYWITVVYWDKDKQHLKEYPVKYDPERWKDLQARVRHLKGFVDRGEIPEYNRKTCDTTFCSHVRYCREMGAPV